MSQDMQALALDQNLINALAALGGGQRVLMVILPPGVEAVTVHLCAPPVLDAVDEAILGEVKRAGRHDGDLPTGQIIAARLGWAPSTVYDRLRRLEGAGHVYRPLGERSGYAAPSHSEQNEPTNGGGLEPPGEVAGEG